MEEELKDLLKDNLELSKENNKLLRKINKFQRWSTYTKIFYWFIIIGVAAGSFYFMKPFITNILNVYSGGVSDINQIKNIGNKLDISGLKDLLNR